MASTSGINYAVHILQPLAAREAPNVCQCDSQKLRNLPVRLTIGLQPLHELLVYERSAFFDTLFSGFLDSPFDRLFDPLFDPLSDTFFVRFSPDACLTDVVEFEHAANLSAVKFVIAPYQHFFGQFYDDVGPPGIRLWTRPQHQV
jgi:hypothetical protein